MNKSEPVGMQRLTLHTRRSNTPVKYIRHQRMSNRCHVNTNLMSSSGVQSAPNETPLIAVLEKFNICSSQLSRILSHVNQRHAQTVARIPADRRINFALTGADPGFVGQGQILAADLVRSEHSNQCI